MSITGEAAYIRIVIPNNSERSTFACEGLLLVNGSNLLTPLVLGEHTCPSTVDVLTLRVYTTEQVCVTHQKVSRLHPFFHINKRTSVAYWLE